MSYFFTASLPMQGIGALQILVCCIPEQHIASHDKNVTSISPKPDKTPEREWVTGFRHYAGISPGTCEL